MDSILPNLANINLPFEDRAFDFAKGELLLIDKPKGWTSFDVVNRLRYRLRKITGIKRIKVGHSGTLDPMATGLLLIATGKCTKQLNELTGLPKSYSGKICFGGITPSYDAETEVTETFETSTLSLTTIQETVAQNFLGEITQYPPIYSAIKVNGQRLYKAARKGKEVEIPSRQVVVSQFDINNYNEPEASFYVSVSKGTYIRSLAHDLGKELNNGAYLSALIRESIGDFKLKNAYDLEKFTAFLDQKIEEQL